MYSGQHHVVQILGNASQHRFGGLCLLIRGLMQSEESFKSGIQKKTIRDVHFTEMLLSNNSIVIVVVIYCMLSVVRCLFLFV